MLKRAFDLVASGLGLLAAAPVLALAAAAIRLSSPGPVLYRARRVGRGGRPFVMHKLRTMHHAPQRTGPAITGAADPRVFPVGAFLRKTKIDELPQLLDVLRGEMSIVGPRPEDPEIVAAHYGADGWESLKVRPGLTSPGTLHYYLYSDDVLTGGDPETDYVERLLPAKLARDVEYLRRATFLGDLAVIFRTLAVITLLAVGRRAWARRLVSAESSSCSSSSSCSKSPRFLA